MVLEDATLDDTGVQNGLPDDNVPNENNENDKDEMINNNQIVNDHENGGRTTRARTVTEKGEGYQRDLLFQRRKSHHNRLVRQLTLVAQCLESSSVEMTNQEVSNLDRIFADLVDANLKYSESFKENDEESRVECQEYFDKADEMVFQQKTKVCSWLREQDVCRKGSRTSGRSSHSSRSSSKADSKKSRSSKADSKKSFSSKNTKQPKSNESVGSSASSTQSVENKAHLVGLRVELESLQQNWNSTLGDKVLSFQQAEEARMKQQLLKLKENIAVTEAKQEVYDGSEPGLDNKNLSCLKSRRRSSSMGIRDRRKVQLYEEDKRRAKSSDRKPKSENVNKVSSDLENNGLSQAVIDMLALSSAPSIELDKFSGNILEFEYFKANFKELVESKVKDQRGRLARLLQYTSGDAKELIKGCVHESMDTCYDYAMSLLHKEYGDAHATTCAYLKELRNWPSIQSNDISAYKKMYRFLLKCKSFKNSGKLAELDGTDKIRMILSKFVTTVQQSWNRNACKIREKSAREANFDDLLDFVDMQCRLISNPAYSQDAFTSSCKSSGVNVLATHCATDPTTAHKYPEPPGKPPEPPSYTTCLCCSAPGHLFEDCPIYLQKSLVERRKFVFHHRLCFACFKPTSSTHNAKSCDQKKTCKKCPQTHPTCLQHISVSTITQSSKTNSYLPIVPVLIYPKDMPDQCVRVYAMLDECSEATFIKSSVMQLLSGAPTRNAELELETVIGDRYVECTAVEDLRIIAIPEHRDRYHSTSLQLPTCFTQEKMPVDSKDIPPLESLTAWPYLASVADSMYRQDESVPVGLLIGNNCKKALEPIEVVPSQGDGPYAIRTCLGWCVVGSLRHQSPHTLSCNATSVRLPAKDIITDEVSAHHFGVSTAVKECSISRQLKEMYMHEFVEAEPERKALSGEDRAFLEKMKEGISKDKNGHYILPLPFRNPDVCFPNNRSYAVKLAQGSLKKRLKNNPQFREEYTAYIKRIIDEGRAKKVPISEANDPNVWYIPTHAVYHPLKEKIRVVFNGAATFKGRCLNEELLQGPDLANLSIGVLMRFRKEEIAVQADLTWMFFQVFVPEDQQKFLRFVFWPEGDLDAEMEDYQMCVHIFGAKSSTSCCIYALHRTALDNVEKFSKEVCDTILKNFYIDDMLKSYVNDTEALRQVPELIKLCEEGGFSLTKFVSNSAEVLKSIPEEKKASTAQIEKEIWASHIERALGVTWYVENDKLGFRIALNNAPLTRRGMLSTISSSFDPFGTAGPFLIKGKRLLQLTNLENKSWDDPVSEEYASAWNKWKQDLVGLNDLTIDRCYKPAGFGKVVHKSIHCFSDASDIGYGQVTYIRQENEAGQIAVSQVIGKARVAPSKITTIPRLELVAATMSTKVAALVKEELQMEGALEEIYYTDSEIVLGYIGNDVKRYRTFVANRRQIIINYTKYIMWRHVISANNPADLASRGISMSEVDKIKLWIEGPEFLRASRETWQTSPPLIDVQESDPEVVNNVRVMATTENEEGSVLAWFEKRLSKWERWIRVLVHVKRAIKYFKEKKVGRARRTKFELNKTNEEVMQSLGFMRMNEVEAAENILIKLIQQRSYPEEIKIYKEIDNKQKEEEDGRKKEDEKVRKNKERRKKKLKNRLSRLDPFLDENGILRVGGRLRRAECLDVEKHPAILPDKAIATRRLIRFHHGKVHHSGRTTTVAEVRQSGFWVVNINSCVRNLIYSCVPCRALRGKLAEQKMADLPDYRTTPEGPFVLVGLDMFGPFLVKEKRSQVKRYVALYTCLSSRAVHLETTKDMSTDSFILSLRRFMARRGAVRSIRSDNGTNFVGAETELLKGWREMDHDKIREFLLGKRCDWITWERNPPAASHMGGVWERQIRTIRSILSSLLQEHSSRLDDEALRTLLCEAECVINSRPLAVENLGDAHTEVLTPNNLLTMKSKIVLPPPGVFQKEDVYCRKRWKAVQYLANQFWSRWKNEYLVTLQQRNKWQSKKRNFQVNDVVLIKEDSSRNQWPMGRVVSVTMDTNDGLVRIVDVYSAQANTTLTRPIHKLVLLVGADELFK